MRVLELSDTESAAAYCGKLLVRSGAEVIKVERPDREHPEEPLDRYLNGGKRRVALDYRRAQDREQLSRLAAGCDLLVTDAAAADVERFALLELGNASHPTVRTSITPFGLSGPYRDWKATTATLLAHAGHTWLCGDPGRAPLTMPGNYPWYQAGTFAYVASMASRLRGQHEPEGAPQTIEVSVLECLTSLHQFTDTMWTFGRQLRSRHGSRFENICPTGLLPCKDGWMGIHVMQNFWEPFALMIGHPEFAKEGHPFADNAKRMEHQDELDRIIIEALSDRPKREIFQQAQETWRITMGYVATLQDVLDDPHLADRDFWQPLGSGTTSDGKGLVTAGAPYRIVGDKPSAEPGVSPLGADTAEALRTLPEEVEATPVMTSRPPAEPLQGIRVLDLTRVWSGPLATRMLADLGAEVIKIESLRPTGSMATIRAAARPPSQIARAVAAGGKFNRNKKSVAIDLKNDRGHSLFLRLVAESDVVIENFSARTMPGLDLGYERLREANERIIYVSLPAFGTTGPYRDYVGYGPSVEPVTGLTALMGYSDDEPRATATALPDAVGGTNAAAAVLMALDRRHRTGQGAFIDLSQHETGVAFLGEHFIERQLTGREPERIGNGHRVVAPHGVYRCRGEDNWIAIVARDEEEWTALCNLSARGWAGDRRFATLASRREHRDALDHAIDTWTATHDKIELSRELQERGVPAGAVLWTPEWLDDPHLAERGYYVELDTPSGESARWDGSPLRFDGERGYDRWVAAPTLGAHNASVLSDILGLSDEDVAGLYEQGVIGQAPPP